MTKVQSDVLSLLPDLVAPHDPEDADPPTRDILLKERALKAFTRSHAGCLIISPTRELATQIANEALKVTERHNGFQVRLFVGGMSKRQQMREWMRGRRDIVVGTPGRLRDVLENEPEVAKALADTKMLILDEADTLLDLGFREDIEAIKKFLPDTPQRQTFLFSATVSPAVRQVAESFLAPNHKYINCVSGSDPSPVHAHVPQYHTVLPSPSQQIPHLLRLLAHDQLTNPGASKTIVFLPTTKMTQLFSEILRNLSRSALPAGRNTRVYELHSKRSQESRSRTSDAFRADKGVASILVTSDVSARGVDYPGVTRVIQVGIPSTGEQYVHRVGRTGRGGKAGGRGDLVLLPWELGFVTWQLTKVPLKPLTVNDLQSQLKTLATSYDADPSAFSVSNTRQRGPLFPAKPLLPVIEDIEQCVTESLAELNEEEVEETFMSLLGFYMGKAQELRSRKSEILDGCKAWYTEEKFDHQREEAAAVDKVMEEVLQSGTGNLGVMNEGVKDGAVKVEEVEVIGIQRKREVKVGHIEMKMVQGVGLSDDLGTMRILVPKHGTLGSVEVRKEGGTRRTPSHKNSRQNRPLYSFYGTRRI
ncbi:hypothetical protein ONZ45_g17854 [Pleurotus djamor]|nr:hypothetical protein ONZ45_g17854 [Pleurotus djamor]